MAMTPQRHDLRVIPCRRSTIDGHTGSAAQRSGGKSARPRMIRIATALVVVGGAFGRFALSRSAALNTVSTDDAYVNGHVTFVAARVAGQVTKVLVDDNNRVNQGDLLVQLDKEPSKSRSS